MTAAPVHLIGSVPLPDAATVFTTVAAGLGPLLSRIPDGEPGERRRWIYFQRLMLERHPAMEPDPAVPLFALRQWDGKLLHETPLLRVRDGVVFETGYARWAITCVYGSPADEHLVMPRDSTVMVEIANDLRRGLSRSIDFLHMPVPRERADAADVRPLADLTGFDDTALYLGLIHHDDREGDVARIRAAWSRRSAWRRSAAGGAPIPGASPRCSRATAGRRDSSARP